MTDIRPQLPVGLLLSLSSTNKHFTNTGGSNALPLDNPSRSIHDGRYDLADRQRINDNSLSMPGRDGSHTEPPTPPLSGPSSFDEPATRRGYATQAKDAEENSRRDTKASRQTANFSPTATRLSSLWDPAPPPPPPIVMGGQIIMPSAAGARHPVPPPPRPPPDSILGARENSSRTREVAHGFTIANTHPPPPPPPPPPSLPIPAALIGPSPASVPEPTRVLKPAPYPPPPPPPPPPDSVGVVKPLEGSRTLVETPTLSRETVPHPRVPPPTSRPLLSSIRDPSPSSSGYSESDDDSVDRDPYKALNERRFPPTLPADFGRSDSQVRGTVSKVTARIFQFENVLSPSLNTSSDDDSDDSGGTADTEIDLQNVWAQLKERRQKLYDMRQRMAAKRRALRDIRRMKDEADNAFMSLLRPILVKSRRGAGATSDDMLDKRLFEMQRARTEYGWQESEYEGLETLLDEEEIELDKLETRFFSLLAVGRAKSARHPRPQEEAEAEQLEESQDVPIELRGISRDGPPDDSHPLWLALLSALADLQLAREDHDDILLQREQVQYDMEVKKNAGLAPADDEWEFLNEFPKEEREKKDNLIRWTEEVARLKKLCVEKGAMKKNLPFRVAYLLDPLIDDDDMALDPTPATSLAHKVFPVILSQPDHVVLPGGPYTEDGALRRAAELPDDDPTKETQRRLAIKEHRIHELMKLTENDNKLSFITRWLLHQLRTSPMSAELLYLTFTRDLRILDPYKWQMDVLNFWFKDETFKTADGLASARTQGEVDDLEVEFDVDLFGHYDNSYAFSETLLPTEESTIDDTG